MSRFSIGIQIGIGFAFAVVLMAISAALTLGGVQRMREREHETRNLMMIRQNVSRFAAAMVDEETAMRGYVASGKPAFLEPLQAARAHQQTTIATIRSTAAGHSDIAAQAETAIADAATVDAFFDSEIALMRARRQADAIARLGDGKISFDAFRSAADNVYSTIEHTIDDSRATYERAASAVTIVVIVSTVLASLATAAFAFVLGASVRRRLQRVTNGLHAIVTVGFADLLSAYDRLAAGDLTASFSVRSESLADAGHDEIAQLIGSFNELGRGLSASAAKFAATTAGLRAAIGSVDANARDVQTASAAASERVAQQQRAVSDISSIIDGVARGAAEQSEGVQSVSTAAEELSRTAEQIAVGSADQAHAVQAAGDAVNRLDQQIASFAQLGTSLSDAARRANEQTSGVTASMHETAAAMTSLRDEAALTGQAMTQLEEKSAAVEEIVSTIDEIADQTNLLALNAAIEAARAGEHGRGFSVVADEVRKLAERATASTRQINTILSEIRRETRTTSAAVRASVTSMEAGLTLASRAAEALQGVNDAITDTTRIADEVATGATTMRNASSEVTANVSSVSAVVEENAAAASQMRTTTQLLTSAMLPISTLAMEQSAAASQVADSAKTLAALVMGTSNGARAISEKSAELMQAISGFTFEGGPVAGQAERSARPGVHA